MTTKTKLTELVDEAMTSVTAFYQRAIELHNDPALRLLASQSNEGKVYVVIYEDDDLFYEGNGFNLLLTESIALGDDPAEVLYHYEERTFEVNGNKLVVDAGQYGQRYQREMLSLFPELTVETIEEKLAEEIKDSHWLRGEGK